MARGWESKAVESQREDAQADETRKKLTPEEIERLRKREGLELSRLRVVNELKAATAPARKTALEHALRHLDDELARLRD